LKMSGVDADVVVSAVSAGAAAGLTSTTSRAVADAYAGLKRLIADRYADVDVTAVQTKPGSTAKRDSLAEDLHDAGAGMDEELVAAAQRVLTVVAEHAPAVGPVWLIRRICAACGPTRPGAGPWSPPDGAIRA